MDNVTTATDRAHDRPNIIVILADDLGFSDFGCYGSEISTPTIDELASNGLRFTQMYTAARCCPSRASLLTGLYPHQAGVGHMAFALGPSAAYQGYLNENCVTIAEPLRQAGYRTLMAGKWHVARKAAEGEEWADGRLWHPLPRERGFDEFFGTMGGPGSYFFPANVLDNETEIQNEDLDWYFTDAITDRAIDMVSRAVQDETPFFLYLAYTAPHWPLHALEEDIARYEHTYRNGWDATRTARHEQLTGFGLIDEKWPISPRDPDAWDWSQTRHPEWEAHRMAVYAAQVHRMDYGVGRLVQTLRDAGQLDDTLIFVLSDNGGCAEWIGPDDRIARALARDTPDGRVMRGGNRPDVFAGPADTFQSYDLCWANVSNAPFRRFKRWVHEGGIATPLVVHWPRQIPSPGLRHCPAHLIDLMPTCLEAAGAQYPQIFNEHPIHPVEGESLMRAFRDDRWERSRPLYFEHEGNRALRDGPWKLVSEYPGMWELYNLDNDRTELDNLAENEQSRVQRMTHDWADWAKHVSVDLEFRQRLASLFDNDTTLTGGHRAELLRK